ncbi:DUF2058 domain-containing protein [Aliidiomarina sanyensis]|uniref:DUF2058 domain-containing protein n=1 Tax=Aliidiomarina sanyensis TaxID=1249555 RepID=A0A432WEQ4_9GAMM|nr:DUF2058 domain-containing protein [Aliidiomarina sanyensis]RUO31359.1 DUF2058 domain-containing protein [Aliidiomarina sanyensis]
MKNALQEQLLKAGLADAKKLKSLNKEKHRAKKQAGKKHVVVNEATRLAEEKRQQQIARDQALNQQRKVESEQRAIAAQVKQLIDVNRVSGEGDITFNFADGAIVKRIYVTQKHHNEISRGQLAIVRDQKAYALVPAQVAEKIQQRMPDVVVLLNTEAEHSDSPTEDDPYADYQIPDDLMW